MRPCSAPDYRVPDKYGFPRLFSRDQLFSDLPLLRRFSKTISRNFHSSVGKNGFPGVPVATLFFLIVFLFFFSVTPRITAPV